MTHFKVYEYEIKDGDKKYKGRYSIKADVKPLKFKKERLVEEFDLDLERKGIKELD